MVIITIMLQAVVVLEQQEVLLEIRIITLLLVALLVLEIVLLDQAQVLPQQVPHGVLVAVVQEILQVLLVLVVVVLKV
jgi:hypothetical protein